MFEVVSRVKFQPPYSSTLQYYIILAGVCLCLGLWLDGSRVMCRSGLTDLLAKLEEELVMIRLLGVSETRQCVCMFSDEHCPWN